MKFKTMLKLLKSVWLGVALIIVASGLLLFSDLERRQGDGRRLLKNTLRRPAAMQAAATGVVAGKILHGIDTNMVGVKNIASKLQPVNQALAAEFNTNQLQAGLEPVRVTAASPGPQSSVPARPWEIRIARYNDAQFSVDTWRGILDGFKNQGLREGVDFNVRCLNAQGDITTLTSIMTAIRSEQPDLVMPISTPALQAALRQTGGLPIVFACVGDGVRAGAGTSETDHLPNVTGITTRSPFAAMARLIKESVPGVHVVGTLFSPAEINSELYREWFTEALEKEGLELIAVPVTTSAEVTEAVSVLLRRDIQVVGQLSDNTTRPAFIQMVRRTRDAKMAFFCFDSTGMRDGATLALARDFYASGVEAAWVAVKVLRGASPENIPFTNTRTETLAINTDLIAKYGIVISKELLKKAQLSTGEKP